MNGNTSMFLFIFHLLPELSSIYWYLTHAGGLNEMYFDTSIMYLRRSCLIQSNYSISIFNSCTYLVPRLYLTERNGSLSAAEPNRTFFSKWKCIKSISAGYVPRYIFLGVGGKSSLLISSQGTLLSDRMPSQMFGASLGNVMSKYPMDLHSHSAFLVFQPLEAH